MKLVSWSKLIDEDAELTGLAFELRSANSSLLISFYASTQQDKFFFLVIGDRKEECFETEDFIPPIIGKMRNFDYECIIIILNVEIYL
jgi:hypothetical protein